MRESFAVAAAQSETVTLSTSGGSRGNRDVIGDGSLQFLLPDIVMPRTARVAPGGFVYHVLNRSVGRMHMFRKESDFEAFERVMVEAHLRQPIRILSWNGRRTGRLASTLL
jgi:hypothetical protein